MSGDGHLLGNKICGNGDASCLSELYGAREARKPTSPERVPDKILKFADDWIIPHAELFLSLSITTHVYIQQIDRYRNTAGIRTDVVHAPTGTFG